MVKKTGLGKGLDALFSMPVAQEEQRQAGDELRNLKLRKIEVKENPFSVGNKKYKNKLMDLLPSLEIIDQEDKVGERVETTDYHNEEQELEDDEDYKDEKEEEVEYDEELDEEEGEDDK